MTLNTPDTPHELAIDFGGDRFPVSGSRPRLSWKPPRSAAALDEEYELQIHIDGQPEQIALVVGHLLVDWPMRPLRSGEQIRWRARTRAATEASEWSAWHAFEAGLLEADWTASWITPADDPQIAQLAPGTRPAAHPARHIQHAGSRPCPPVRHGPRGVRGVRERQTRRHCRTRARLDLLRTHPLRPGRRRHRIHPPRRQQHRDRVVRRLVPRPGRSLSQTHAAGANSSRPAWSCISTSLTGHARSSAPTSTGPPPSAPSPAPT